ncbi:MAG: PIN domain-containing protein [Gammaproteobacteria bacterium]|nr:PIN domain-containing protein [Gammaproteobacteria bacterium]
MLYFDTSAVLPYYRAERASEEVERLLRAQAQPVWISDLVQVEFASALSRWVRTGELEEPQAHRIEAAFHEDRRAGRFVTTAIGQGEFRQAREWLGSFKTALRTLDALHLACAHLQGHCLVTLNRVMMKAAEFWGLETLAPGSDNRTER